MKAIALCIFVMVSATAGSPCALGSPIYFSSQSDFLASAGTVMLDDFNDLAAFDNKTTFARLGYTVSSPNGLTAANVAPFPGSRSLVLFGGNALQPVTFSFDSPVSAFGLFIGDAAEGSNSTLSFTNNLGHNFTIASGPLPDNSVIFFGVIDLQNPFTSVTIQGNTSSDGFAMDDVYITTAVPEPTSMVLFGISAVVLGLCTIRCRGRQRCR